MKALIKLQEDTLKKMTTTSSKEDEHVDLGMRKPEFRSFESDESVESNKQDMVELLEELDERATNQFLFFFFPP